MSTRRPAPQKPSLLWAQCIAGLLLAFVSSGYLIGFIATPRGGIKTAFATEMRIFGEGVAVSHFLDNGERLTGNAALSGAELVIILGNSFVEALQVPDASTMGAILERISRASNRPLNVHQYGWSGESLAQYLRLAAFIRDQNPARIIVVIHKYDLCTVPLTPSPKGFSVRIRPDLLAEIQRHSARPSALHQALLDLMDHSALLTAFVRRATDIMESSRRAAAPACDERMPPAFVRSLEDAYGARLLIAYIADVGIPADARSDGLEAALFHQCELQHVACLSSRDAMVDEFQKRFAVARGFHNTKIGVGHLNEHGHRLMGLKLWKAVAGSN